MRPGRWGKMQVGCYRGKATIDFFRIWMPLVQRPQASFHMTESNLPIESEQGSGNDGGCITNCQHPIWFKIRKNGIKMREDGCAQFCKGLIVPHQVKIILRFDLKQLQHLIEHLPMLSRNTNARFNPCGLTQ